GLRLEMAIEAVVRSVDLAVVEPAEERRLGLVQRPGERLVPGEVLAGEPRPEALEVALGLVAQRLVGGHARDVRLLDELRGRRKEPILLEHGLDGCGTHGDFPPRWKY